MCITNLKNDKKDINKSNRVVSAIHTNPIFSSDNVYCKKNKIPLKGFKMDKSSTSTIHNTSRKTSGYKSQTASKNSQTSYKKHYSTHTVNIQQLNNLYNSCQNSPLNLYEIPISFSLKKSPSMSNNIIYKKNICKNLKNFPNTNINNISVNKININERKSSSDIDYNNEYLQRILVLEKENKKLRDIIGNTKNNKELSDNKIKNFLINKDRSSLKGKIIDNKIQTFIQKHNKSRSEKLI